MSTFAYVLGYFSIVQELQAVQGVVMTALLQAASDRLQSAGLVSPE